MGPLRVREASNSRGVLFTSAASAEINPAEDELWYWSIEWVNGWVGEWVSGMSEWIGDRTKWTTYLGWDKAEEVELLTSVDKDDDKVADVPFAEGVRDEFVLLKPALDDAKADEDDDDEEDETAEDKEEEEEEESEEEVDEEEDEVAVGVDAEVELEPMADGAFGKTKSGGNLAPCMVKNRSAETAPEVLLREGGTVILLKAPSSMHSFSTLVKAEKKGLSLIDLMSSIFSRRIASVISKADWVE